MRMIFSGNIHERVYLYFQPDFASSASSMALHFGQIRDMYFDIALDEKKEYRVRYQHYEGGKKFEQDCS
jgi:hypothetical protein